MAAALAALSALLLLPACTCEDAAGADAGGRAQLDAAPAATSIPDEEWRVEIDRPERNGPSAAFVVGSAGGSWRWEGRSLLPDMTERHTGTFQPTGHDLHTVWRELERARFFDARDGARDLRAGALVQPGRRRLARPARSQRLLRCVLQAVAGLGPRRPRRAYNS